jgi:hypothetical protein
MKTLAEKWVSYYLNGGKEDYSAVEKPQEIAQSEPIRAWKIIKEINSIQIDDRDWEKHINAIVGCGPLEDIIALHADLALEYILIEAKENTKLKEQLSVIYESSIPKRAWERIQNAIA